MISTRGKQTDPCLKAQAHAWPRNDHDRVLFKWRTLLASQRGLDLFQAIDVFLQAGDVILHFYEG